MLLRPERTGEVAAQIDAAPALIVQTQNAWHHVAAFGRFKGRRAFLTISDAARRSTGPPWKRRRSGRRDTPGLPARHPMKEPYAVQV